MSDVLERLAGVLESRRGAEPSTSYVAALHAGGRERILEKVTEECAELVAAARCETDANVVHETADLWFHTLVLLSERGLGPHAVLAELERRFGVSGLDEKRARSR